MATANTLDGAVRATPYHPDPPPRPKPRTPRAKRNARVKIPTVPRGRRRPSLAPAAPPASGLPPRSQQPAPAPLPRLPGAAGPVGAIPAVAPAAGVPGPPGFPSYGDPVLDARRRAIAAVTDAATAAATKDAAAGSANLGMLAQLAGMGRVQTQGTTLPPAVAALPGILSQDAQQGLLTRNALAVDSANRIAPYMRAQGLSTLAQFDAGIRDAKLKARADELDFLGRIYQQAILSGNAQLADATKRAIADKQAQTALDVAGTRAEATKTAAQIAADARVKTAGGGGGAGGKTPAQKAAYVVLKNQWVKAAKYDAATGSFGPRDGGTDPTTGAKIRIPGEKPRQFVNRMIKAGVTPVDAIGIADAAGVTMNYKMIYVWLIPHVGKKRARLLTMRLAGGSDPTAREG